MPHPIENMLRTTMEQLHQIVDVDTVIGSPVAVDGAVILPVSRVSLGLLTGGGEYEGQGDAARCGRTFDGAGAPYPFTGASALGAVPHARRLSHDTGRARQLRSRLVRGDAGAADRPRAAAARRGGADARGAPPAQERRILHGGRRQMSGRRPLAALLLALLLLPAQARAAVAPPAVGARGAAPHWRRRRGRLLFAQASDARLPMGQHHEDHDGANRAGAVQRGRDGHRPARGVRRGGLEHVPERGRGAAALRFAVRAHARLRQRRGRGHRLPCGGQRWRRSPR